MEIGKMEVDQEFLSKGETGAIMTIIGKEQDRVKVRNKDGREYYLPNDYDPDEKMTTEKELQEIGKKALEGSPFSNPVITEKPRNKGAKAEGKKQPKVRERFLELLRKGSTRAEINEAMKDTSIPILFNWSLQRLEERGITIKRPADKKTGKYYATGTLVSKKTATLKEHPAIKKLAKKAKKNLR